MKVDFLKFIERITMDYPEVDDAISDFKKKNDKHIEYNSGGKSTLSMDMHSTFREYVYKLLENQKLNPTNTQIRKSQEITLREELKSYVTLQINGNIRISQNSNLSAEDIAQHFIKIVFDPLYNDAKKINTELKTLAIREGRPK